MAEGVLLDTFSIYQGRKEAMSKLRAAIKKFVEESKRRVLFLVDELDRCRPDYTISYLETIKHIFDVQGAVFVLAADRQQLENSAKTAFGPNLDFEEYYRKICSQRDYTPTYFRVWLQESSFGLRQPVLGARRLTVLPHGDRFASN